MKYKYWGGGGGGGGRGASQDYCAIKQTTFHIYGKLENSIDFRVTVRPDNGCSKG